MRPSVLPTDQMSIELTYPGSSAEAGASLAAQMRPALVKFFTRKTGSAVEAEDLAQEVLTRALSHVDWKVPHQARGYIFRTAVNCLRDRRRRLAAHGQIVAWDED